MLFERSSGVLLHPSSLPGRFGIGDLGVEAYEFVDFLERARQKLWQILPLGPTGFGESPYQCFSAFAGNANLISPDKLVEAGLLRLEDIGEIPDFRRDMIEFDSVIKYKGTLFERAYQTFSKGNFNTLREEYNSFIQENKSWLDNYAFFMALKEAHGGIAWNEWESDIASRKNDAMRTWSESLSERICYYKFIQFIFSIQWRELKAYANSKGIKIVGDIPIFVSYDSSDVWASPDLFDLDSKGYPRVVAGVPPDSFTADGQLWGNPHYNWEKMKKIGYKWWIDVIRNILQNVDIVRIDHFRGFESYWEIPYGDKTAAGGRWVKGPGEDLFSAIENVLGMLPIIAEDLGYITPEVLALRERFDFPGMNILLFAFGGSGTENRFLPYNHNRNSVVYTGTHDNDTVWGAFSKYPEEVKDYVKDFMNTQENGPDISWDYIRTAFSSAATMAIIPMQDLMCLGTEARMNVPGTLGGNWVWRYEKSMLDREIEKKLRRLTELYGR